jgi:hypothetical protein
MRPRSCFSDKGFRGLHGKGRHREKTNLGSRDTKDHLCKMAETDYNEKY